MVSEVTVTKKEKGWIIDSGASEHMTYDRSSFSEYYEYEIPKHVRYGNNNKGEVAGIGNIQVKSLVGYKQVRYITLTNVLHVPSIRKKLFSVGTACNAGIVGQFNAGQIIFYDENGVKQIVAKREGNFYKAQLKVVKIQACSVETVEPKDIDIWSQRLGHINKKTIIDIVEHDAVVGVNIKPQNKKVNKTIDRIDCEPCAFGKQSRKHTPISNRERAKEVGNMVHLDICGPVGVPTLSLVPNISSCLKTNTVISAICIPCAQRVMHMI